MTKPLDLAVAQIKARTSDQIAARREKTLQLAKAPRPLPKGQNIFDAICGKIQSDETDEEVLKALEKLS